MVSVSDRVSKRVPAREVALVQFLEVIDLAVERDPDRAVFVRERLVAAL